MSTHFDNLSFYIPDLKKMRILDLGSGRGNFLIEAARAGATAVGLEKFEEYIRIAEDKAKEAGVHIDVVQGEGETLPFADNSFDFVNMCEVIEHVENPEKVLSEVRRVLSSDGKVYVSAPNRFGMKDQHFHLYFVNFLPRSLSSFYIGLFGRHKSYSKESGRQRLHEMHYYTRSSIFALGKKCGFLPQDMRSIKIEKKYGTGILGFIARTTYRLIRSWYFDSYHILLSRTK